MKNKNVIWVSSFILAFALAAPSFGAPSGQPGPCEQIKNACSQAGFIKGDAKQGKGLFKDCIDPIIQGKTNSKATLPVPSVDPSVVSACKAKHPKFGEGKIN